MAHIFYVTLLIAHHKKSLKTPYKYIIQLFLSDGLRLPHEPREPFLVSELPEERAHLLPAAEVVLVQVRDLARVQHRRHDQLALDRAQGQVTAN